MMDLLCRDCSHPPQTFGEQGLFPFWSSAWYNQKAPGAQTNRLGQTSAGEIFGLAAETHRLIFSNAKTPFRHIQMARAQVLGEATPSLEPN
jgi:hypothetical protein